MDCIYKKYNIDISKLKRDYIKLPLKHGEMIDYEDLIYLYNELNLRREDISSIFNISIYKVKRMLRKYKIIKDTKQVYNNIKKSMIKKYGVEHYSKTDDFSSKVKQTKFQHFGNETYNNRKKAYNTMIKKYGTTTPMLVNEFVKKFKRTNIEKYGVEYPMQNKKIQKKLKEVMIEKYGVDNSMKMKDIIIKVYNTKIKNKTSTSSKAEDIIYDMLINFFPDTKRQYKSEKYPFSCDFYIPEIDTYIEYQGFWSHGPYGYKEPYNKNNKVHKNIIKLWKQKNTEQYNKAIDTWTRRDPLKREIAKKNNLNWIEFFNMKQFNDWYNNLNKEIA